MKEIRVEKKLPYPPETVWNYVATRDGLSQWLMPNTFEPKVGHEFTFQTDPAPGFDGVVHCRVTKLEPPKHLIFTWVGGGLDSTVQFHLEPIPEGTRVTVQHHGFKGRNLIPRMILGFGWKKLVRQKLPAAIVDDSITSA